MTMSLVQLVQLLSKRVAALEQLAAQKVSPFAVVLEKAKEPEAQPKNKKMCPHCGVKPNYFFHVKNCPEKNKNNVETTFRRRDPGTT